MRERRRHFKLACVAAIAMLFVAGAVWADAVGFAEYYLLADEQHLINSLRDIPNSGVPAIDTGANVNSRLSIVSSADGCHIYLDEWEDGYDFDPSNAYDTADAKWDTPAGGPGEQGAQLDTGDTLTLSETDTFVVGSEGVDGGDRLYISGAPISVVRVMWPDDPGSYMAGSWELYPVQAWQDAYTAPIGENLDFPENTDPFEYTYLFVEAFATNTKVVLIDPTLGSIQTNILTAGENIVYSNILAGMRVTASDATLPTAAKIQAGLISSVNQNVDTRYFTLTPDEFLGSEYYVPVPTLQFPSEYFGASFITNVAYIYAFEDNTEIEIETITETISVTLTNRGDVCRFQMPTMPNNENQGFYGAHIYALDSSKKLWLIGSCDDDNDVVDWGYQTLGMDQLHDEYYLPFSPANPLHITPVSDNTVFFVDWDNDGTSDTNFILDRLETKMVYDPDTDAEGARVYADGLFVMSWGQDNTQETPGERGVTGPADLDFGYTVLPLRWKDDVIGIEKTANPENLPTNGGTVMFTLVVTSLLDSATVFNVDIEDTLPTGWAYDSNTTVISFSDGTPTNTSDPSGGVGPDLLWDLDHDLAPSQTVTLVFSATTVTGVYQYGWNVNESEAWGYADNDLANSNAFVFNPSDRAAVYIPAPPAIGMGKSSDATNALDPGDTITYTISMTNIGAVQQNDIRVRDYTPTGTAFVADSVVIIIEEPAKDQAVADYFSTASYGNNDGLFSWSGNWDEVGDDDDPEGGTIQISGGQLRCQQLGANDYILRSVDLSGRANATLSFDWTESGLEEIVRVYASDSSSGPWTVLGNFSDEQGSGSESYDITSYISADTSIRFGNEDAGWNAANDTAFFDNIKIEFPVPEGTYTNSSSGNFPPVLANDYSLSTGKVLTIMFDVTIDSPSHYTQIVNTAYMRSDQQDNLSAHATDTVVIASIGDFVWQDNNTNHVFDTGDFGLTNVTVNLYDSSTNLVLTTNTGSTGYYEFDGLPPGTYLVEAIAPTNRDFVLQDFGGDDSIDSDANSSGWITNLTLVRGSTATNWDIGLYVYPGSISDFVWYDENMDGDQDGGETGIVTTVNLYDGTGTILFDTTVSDTSGYYIFNLLTAGTYVVEFEAPTNHYYTTKDFGGETVDSDADDTTGKTDGIVLGENEDNSDVDAGLYIPPSTVGDYVWFDGNTNGVQDGGESGVAGVTVEIYDANTNLLDSTVSDVAGAYSFTNVVPGNYFLRFVTSGYDFVPQYQGGDGGKDSNADSAGWTDSFSIALDTDNLNIDVGLTYKTVLAVTKVSDATGSLAPGDTVTYTITLTNSGTSSYTNIAFIDPLPEGLEYVSNSTEVIWYGTKINFVTNGVVYTVRDNFSVIAYNNQDGTRNWTGDWVEEGEATDPTADRMRVRDAAEFNSWRWNRTAARGANRAADLSGATNALLSFDYSRDNLDGLGDDLSIYMSTSGVSGWTPIGTIYGDVNDWTTFLSTNFDVTAYISTNTGLRFYGGGNANQDRFYLDNIEIAFTVPEITTNTSTGTQTNPGAAPPNLASGFNIETGRSITVTFQAVVDTTSSVPFITNTVTVTADAHAPVYASVTDSVVRAAIAGTAWIDHNTNGIQNGGIEVGMTGVVVRLYNATSNLVASTATDASGNYLFSSCPTNGCFVGFVLPLSYYHSPKDAGGDTIDSDADAATGWTGIYYVPAGTTNTSADAGFYAPRSALGDFVWYDSNTNGIQDGGETGAVGITVNLYDGDESLLLTTNTDSSGYYTFTNLNFGNYIVEVVPPASYIITFKDWGGDDSVDSDANKIDGRTDVFYLTSNTNEIKWDIGLTDAEFSLGITKTSDAAGALDPGDVITYTVTVVNTGSVSHAIATVTDYIPTGTTYIADSTRVLPEGYPYTNTVADFFDAIAENNQDGSTNWITDWTDPGDNTPGLVGGDVRVFADVDNYQLRVRDDSRNVRRQFDSAGANNIQLSFDYRRVVLGGGDQYVDLDISTNGYAGPWATLHTFVGDDGAYLSTNFDITAYASSNAAIRFLCPSGSMGNGNILWVEDLSVEMIYTSDEGGVPPTIASGYTIDPADSLTVEFQVSVDVPCPLTQITNTATVTSDKNPPISSSVTDTVVVATIGNYVWYDTNTNGIQDDGATGVSNVTVRLYNANTQLLDTTTTDATGYYQFYGWPPTNVFLEFVAPPFRAFVSADQGADDYLDSDVDVATGWTTNFSLSQGTNALEWDAGVYTPPSSIGSYVWYDSNTNGIQDGGETGVSNVTINLFDSGTNLVTSTATDANGDVLFNNLTGGTYFVEFVSSGGYAFTLQDEGSDDNLDSDPVEVTGKTVMFDLPEGTNDYRWDAGVYLPPSSIGDYVWYDSNTNGVQDGGEAIMNNITVNLYDSGTNLIGTTSTDTNGLYLFENISYGNYLLEFERPATHIFTSQDQGGDDSLDSDVDSFGWTSNFYLPPGQNVSIWDAGLRYPADGLSITKSSDAGAGSYNPGDTGTWTITIVNTGIVTQTGVDITDPQPSGTAFVPGSTKIIQGGVTNAGGSPPNLALNKTMVTGDTITVTFDFTVDTPPTESEALNVASVESDIHPKVSASVTNPIVSADLGITKTVYKDDPAEEEAIYYTLLLTNNGPNDATTVQVTDLLPSYVEYKGHTNGSYNSLSGLWNIGDLDAGAYTSLVINVTVNEGAADLAVTNTATVTQLDLYDPVSSNDSDSAIIYPRPLLVILTRFESYNVEGRVLIEWETSSEINTIGFYLFRHDPDRDRLIPVNSRMLYSLIDSPQGGIYSMYDDGSATGIEQTYTLIEVESSGKRNECGPFTVSAVMRRASGGESKKAKVSVNKQERIAKRKKIVSAKRPKKSRKQGKSKGGRVKKVFVESSFSLRSDLSVADQRIFELIWRQAVRAWRIKGSEKGTADVLIRLSEKGRILERRITRSSGDDRFDKSIIRAFKLNSSLKGASKDFVSRHSEITITFRIE